MTALLLAGGDLARHAHDRRLATRGVPCREARLRRPTALPRQALVGRHDFTTFRSVHCQAESPVKTLDRISPLAIPVLVLIGRENVAAADIDDALLGELADSLAEQAMRLDQ